MDKRIELRGLGSIINELMDSISNKDYGTYSIMHLEEKYIDALYVLENMLAWQNSINKGLDIHDKKNEMLSIEIYNINRRYKGIKNFSYFKKNNLLGPS